MTCRDPFLSVGPPRAAFVPEIAVPLPAGRCGVGSTAPSFGGGLQLCAGFRGLGYVWPCVAQFSFGCRWLRRRGIPGGAAVPHGLVRPRCPVVTLPRPLWCGE